MTTSTRARRPAATALWAHLLKADTMGASPDTMSQLTSQNLSTPLNPVDKNGTSARLLLSDTQAQFQKLSETMQFTFKELENTKKEISETKKLFEDQNDRLERFLVELVNRCQNEIQKSMGKPAQIEQTEAIMHRVSLTDTVISNVDKRLDALQALVQSQIHTSQILENSLNKFDQKLNDIAMMNQGQVQQFHQQYQTQAQVLQNLHTQQTAIFNAMKPLQSLHTDFQFLKDSILVEIKEALHAKKVSEPTTPSVETLGKRKRPRLDVEPDASCTRSDPRPASILMHLNSPKGPPANAITPMASRSKTHHPRTIVPPSTMLRRPLADLPVVEPRHEQESPKQAIRGSPKSSIALPSAKTEPALQVTAQSLQGRTHPPSPLFSSSPPDSRSHQPFAAQSGNNRQLFNQYAHRPRNVPRRSIVPVAIPMRTITSLKERALINGKRFIPISDDDDEA